MISRAQQILLKRAQSEACIDDAEYRDTLELLSALPGCRSSKDARLTDRHVDNLLAYFEAIYWRKIDSDQLEPIDTPYPVFLRRGYWAAKNPKGNTSRDRYAGDAVRTEVEALEAELANLGYGMAYCGAIQNNIKPFNLISYKAALERTVKSKQKKVEQPF